jgi:DNA-binding SARP family transcriptional activator/predicted ATPase
METSAVQLTIRLLGAPAVSVGDAPLALNNQKAKALLYYLATTGQAHTRDHLATLLWSESPESNARHSLRSSLYHIRHALNAQGVDTVLSSDAALIHLNLAQDACDVARFHQLLKEGSEQALIEAVSLYRGPLLQGFTLTDASLFDEWLRFEESALNQAYVNALQHLLDWSEQRQAWNEAITYVQRLVQLDPLSEEMQHRLIGLYVRTGTIGRALHQYHRFETTLRQELGSTPSPETQALLSSILEVRHHTTTQNWTRRDHSEKSFQLLPFVGRDDLCRKLLAISEDVRAGHGVTILLQGESGIGKSRLLEEFSANLSSQSPSWILLQGSCSPFDDLLSYGPFLEAFQAAGLGDLIDLLSGTAEADVGKQGGPLLWRVWQALSILARHGPLVLAIDDLQWANSATLQLFGFLALRLHDLPVLLIGTVEHAHAIPVLQRLIMLGRRRDAVYLFSLPPLSIEAVTALTDHLRIDPAPASLPASSLSQWLYEHSDGSPFVLKELIAQLQAEAILTSNDSGLQFSVGRWLRWRATSTLPETVHDLVSWRLVDLSSPARYLLDILAVANQPLPFTLLHEFPDVDDQQLVSLIDDLVTRGLLTETASNWFALSHNLLRDSLVPHICTLRRQTIHRQLARIIEGCPALQKNFPLHQIARHAVMGGDSERARRYGLRVLDELVQDNPSAQTALFLHQLYALLAPRTSTHEMLHLTRAIGQVHQSLGQLAEATAWYHRHLELSYTIADPCTLGEAHFELGELALVANDDQATAAAAKSGLAIVTAAKYPAHMALVARGQRLLGAALAMDGSNLSAAEHYLQEAVAAHRLTDNLSDLCATLFELGNVAAQRGDLRQALKLYEEAARAAEAAHYHYFLALAYNNFAYHSLLFGQCDIAQRTLAKGFALAETHEMFGALLHLASTQGEIHLYRGNWIAASESFQQGLLLAEELGNPERQAGYHAGLALAARGQHKLTEALSLLTGALTLITERGYWHLRTRIQLWQAETLLQCERLAEAELPLLAALETARAHGRMLLLIQGERLHARLLATRNDWQTAQDPLAWALEQASLLDLPLEIARTQAVWGELALQHAPVPHNGRELLSQAQKTLIAHAAHGELAAMATTMTLQ